MVRLLAAAAFLALLSLGLAPIRPAPHYAALMVEDDGLLAPDSGPEQGGEAWAHCLLEKYRCQSGPT